MKNKPIVFILITAIVMVLFPPVSTIKHVNASPRTEIRTTLSRSHYDYWQSSSNPGTFIGQDEFGNRITGIRVGDRPSYTFIHPYYRGLNPGERVKSARIKSGTIGNISVGDFEDSHYEEVNGLEWDKFKYEELPYATPDSNVSLKLLDGVVPRAEISASPKLPDINTAKDITSLATKPVNTNKGFRVHTIFICLIYNIIKY